MRLPVVRSFCPVMEEEIERDEHDDNDRKDEHGHKTKSRFHLNSSSFYPYHTPLHQKFKIKRLIIQLFKNTEFAFPLKSLMLKFI